MDLMLRPSEEIGHGGDLVMTAGDLALDDGLNTAILLSLFSDRRAEPADELPEPSGSRRGWWGDVLAADGRDRLGSRLWLLTRRKQTPETRKLFEEFTKEALAWLIDDGVAIRVDVAAEWKARGTLEVEAVIVRPTGESVKFGYAWDAEIEKLEVIKHAF
jgi:phage gp46-like protein